MTDRERPERPAPEAQPPAMTLDAWVALVRARLGGVDVDRETEAALLDLTRIAAHRSERVAGPITAFLAGVALADVPVEARAGRVRALIEALESEPGEREG